MWRRKKLISNTISIQYFLSLKVMNSYFKRTSLAKISPHELDNALEKGWYRAGQTIFTCSFVMIEGSIYSAIWLRQEISKLKFSKRRRKRLKEFKNEFEVSYQPFEMTEEKIELYKLYRKHFKGAPSFSIQSNLGYYPQGENIFNSYEVSLRKNGELIGYTVFDLGEESITSIISVYNNFDPQYEPLSIGINTMYLEMEFAQENKFKYYYPGYFVPGNERFDYKIKISKSLEFLDYFNQKWLFMDNYSTEKNDFIEVLSDKLFYLLDLMFDAYGFDTDCCEEGYVCQYNLFELSTLNLEMGKINPNLWHPQYLNCYLWKNNDETKHIVVYNLNNKKYELLLCEFDNIRSKVNAPGLPENYPIYMITIRETILASEKAEEIVEKIKEFEFMS